MKYTASPIGDGIQIYPVLTFRGMQIYAFAPEQDSVIPREKPKNSPPPARSTNYFGGRNAKTV